MDRSRREAGPSARLGVARSLGPNRTDRRANSGPSHNIYRASVASCDKNLVYKCVVNNSRLSASCYRELMVKQATACVGLWRTSTGVYCSDSISSIFKIVAFVTISKKVHNMAARNRMAKATPRQAVQQISINSATIRQYETSL